MSNLQTRFQQALAAHQQGDLATALRLYKGVLNHMPKHFDALHLLGVLHAQQGQFDQAIQLIRRAVSINPSHAGAYSNLGNAQVESGLLPEALVSYDRALRLLPQFPDALFNKGNVLKKLKRLDDALNSYDQVLAQVPTHADALINRGNVLQELGREQDACTSYEAALAIQPHAVNALVGYSHLQHRFGHHAAALQAAVTALTVENSLHTRATFFNAVKHMGVSQQQHAQLAPLIIRAMSEPWGKPHELAPAMIGLIRQDTAILQCMAAANQAWPSRLSIVSLFGEHLLAVAQNPSLLCLLKNAAIPDLELEKFLTLAREALLQHAASLSGTDAADPRLVGFHSALARQCFINEYVFYHTQAELEQAHTLAQRLASALESGEPVSPLWVAAVACYFPLHTLPCAQYLRNMPNEASIMGLVRQQVEEPLQEAAYADHIPQLGSMADAVSQQVRQQYEKNPYPRWIKFAPQREKMALGTYLAEMFPHASLTPLLESTQLDYLIAGCGTGHHAVDVAQSFYASRIVAIDLSMKSLCYAQRKTHESAIASIEYTHADIMELGSTGWCFDVIESVGVLHHMANPVAGWRVLVNMLKPGGWMKLGFYSEIARKNLNVEKSSAQTYSTADIRELRQHVMLHSNQAQYADMLAVRDFYSTSECRDLLFHVQEHRFNLLQMRDILAELGLILLGFQLPPQVRALYKQRFPEDTTQTDLESWHRFEQDNPLTFLGMYQFWVQKAAEHP